MNTGMSGTVEHGHGRDGVHRGEADHDDGRHDHGQGQLRQVACEVAVQRVEAARREEDDLAAARLRCPARAQRDGARQQLPPQVRLHDAADPLGDDLGSPAQHGPPGEHDREGGERSGQLGRALASQEGTRDGPGQEPRLRDGQRRGEHPQDHRRRDRDADDPPGREEAPVSWGHARPRDTANGLRARRSPAEP